MADAVACTIKAVPPGLMAAAARVATEVFPANRPAVAQFATLVDGDEADRVDMPQFIAALTTKYWGPKPRVIPVQFMDNPTAAFRRLFLENANAWDCSVTFAEGSGERGVRLSRDRGGYWSYLGTDILLVPPGSVTMNLQAFTERTPDAEWRRVVRHEVGHTLGFPHEHMRRDLIARLDAEKVIAYLMRTQGWSRRDVIAQALTPLDEASLMGTPPEATSIMCYWFPAEVTVDDRDIPGGADLTPTDLAFADAIYPFPAGPAPPPTPPPGPNPPPVGPPEGVLAGLNAARAAAGLPPLVEDATLTAIAAGWAATMAASGEFTHGDSSSRIAPAFPGRPSGEVIAFGQTSATQAVADWMGSPGHRGQILGPYALVGHASAAGAGGRRYWVADFVGGGGTTPPPPVKPPDPPPVKPPDPKPEPEEFGPHDLRIGVPSDRFTLLPNTEFLFRFRPKATRVFFATTQSKADLVMDLLDGRKAPLRSDDDSGLRGNPLVHAPLKPGTYFLRIRGSHPEVMGSFRVKVEALS